MDFPFPIYNLNGTINQGLALRGPGNTFWPPMRSQASTFNSNPILRRSGTSPRSSHQDLPIYVRIH